ncbi:5-amino-6-(5-phospho-D-ribitylamino)uracil phosphatase YcsE [Paenibacillus sp. J31TS4]|uniref:Cof-type HAD-IIB family hydrolase n=1 Tax=Paenibacillus sp. J31TS4 TaxID=2807195 RepID=UPI001B0C5FAA|nr:Cof-type HAD-IIB family hydrolase [Paenibacillus sp. J31TS4]GIP40745.1 5-amino-6-(5-phospho-D-ribitylamino)uracil phosphatase YcsE [Paenibacillus sp. J31TS4]
MGPYKVIALDMDGTVLNSSHAISPENRKWIDKAIEAGITVMFSTGRGVQSVQKYVEELNLQSPMVSVNGSEVWKAPGVLFKRHLMETEWIKWLHGIAATHGTWFWGYAVEGLFNKDHWTDNLDDKQWLKFGFMTDDAEKLALIRGVLEERELFEITNSNVNNLEINPRGISKASGIMDVCNLLGVKMEEVMAMGDSLNDLTMIKESGLGIAMGNAQEELKLAANAVTATNNEDGVALAIRKYAFGLEE